ncbi:hypothetical protein YC2023_003116 [Brassica napus]
MAFAARLLSLMVSSASLAESWTVCGQACTIQTSHGQPVYRVEPDHQDGRINLGRVLSISRMQADLDCEVPRTKSAPCIVAASVGASEIGSTNGSGDYRADNVLVVASLSSRSARMWPTLSLLDTAAAGPDHGHWAFFSSCLVHTDVRVCPSAHTGRPWPSVSTHRTSGCPSVHISARSVDCSGDFGPRGLSVQYTQDVRQHTQDVRGCPCVSVCPSVHTGRPSAHAGRPSAHAGRPWLSVCLRVSVSAHRTSVSTHRTSVSTRRTSVSTRRTSVAVRVCPCVRQCTQDVRQHTQDVRQHTQDVRGCPCVSVCPSAHAGRPSAHAGRPSAHAGRPCLSVSTHRLSVD